VLVNGVPEPANQLLQLDSGAVVDVTDGTIALTASNGSTGTFSGTEPPPGATGPRTVTGRAGSTQTPSVISIFTISQPSDPTALPLLTLTGGDFTACPTTRALSASTAPAKVVRQLWGTAKGQFRTRARYGSATVRGTVWLTQDRCDGSYIFVRQDVVDVFDFTLKKTITLNQGQSYLAKPPKPKPAKPKPVKPKTSPKKAKATHR